MANLLSNDRVTSILMVRHTDVHNPDNIVYGRLPRFGLSDLGRTQAHEVAEFLRGRHVHQLYSSPRLRARQTARAINEVLGCSRIQISHLIDEVLTGYQGQSNAALGKINWYDTPARPSDESIAAIGVRMLRFLQTVRTRHEGETVAAVSHADPIMILRAEILGLPLVVKSLQGPAYPSKGSIMEFTFEGGADHPTVKYDAPVDDPSNTYAKKKEKDQTSHDGG